jgi:hypothetical protein
MGVNIGVFSVVDVIDEVGVIMGTFADAEVMVLEIVGGEEVVSVADSGKGVNVLEVTREVIIGEEVVVASDVDAGAARLEVIDVVDASLLQPTRLINMTEIRVNKSHIVLDLTLDITSPPDI